MFVGELASAVIQVLVFSLIPFIVHVVTAKSAKGFLRSVGLYRPERRTVLLALAASVVLFLVMWGMFFATGTVDMLHDEASVTGMLRAAGFSTDAALTLLAIAWIKTSLSEEILFRGFIGRRLIGRFGFRAGNLLQAALFGVLHGLLITFASANRFAVWQIALIFLLTGAGGWVLGWIKEKKGNGSLIPGWMAHGFGNTVGYAVTAFIV